MNLFEQELIMDKEKIIFAGTDEAGRGPLAGPLVVSAVILPINYFNVAIKDSKKLSFLQRQKLYDEIIRVAISYSIEIINVETIEKLNPKQASIFGMEQAINNLIVQPTLVLTDAENLSAKYNHIAIIDGDNLSQSIGAASILAKVTRDKIMEEYHHQYPVYNFKNNKGYGTKEHLDALKKYSYCAIHRKTYQPIKTMIENKNVNNK